MKNPGSENSYTANVDLIKLKGNREKEEID